MSLWYRQLGATTWVELHRGSFNDCLRDRDARKRQGFSGEFVVLPIGKHPSNRELAGAKR